MKIVADSSPLIGFAILDRLDLLMLIFSEIYIPQAVLAEVSIWNKPYSRQLEAFSKEKLKYVRDRAEVRKLMNDIDSGEAEAIVLALENGIRDILLDDPKGRRIARDKELCPIGTIGVLLEAKKSGYINQVKPRLDKLIANRIRIGTNLYRKALELASE
ncbi:MAG: DUF3368 domain-containing protein [Deltaproteobacteria bacterium]|nr:MAG: DUF3368 domain-containing protein [Deltaproteobacteria bacterium]